MSKCVLHFENESIKKDLKVWAFKDMHLTYIEIHSSWNSRCRVMVPLWTLTVAVPRWAWSSLVSSVILAPGATSVPLRVVTVIRFICMDMNGASLCVFAC